MTFNSIIILILLIGSGYSTIKKELSNPYCEKWSDKQVSQQLQICNQCQYNFILNQYGICQANCIEGTFYNLRTQQCVAVCDEDFNNNDKFGVCEQILECKTIQSYGNDYHHGKVIGIIDLTLTQFLSYDEENVMIIWDKIDLKQDIKLRGLHKYSLDGFLLFPVEKLLLSWSVRDIILWDLLEGDYIVKQNLPEKMFSKSSVHLLIFNRKTSQLIIKYITSQGQLMKYDLYLNKYTIITKVDERINQIKYNNKDHWFIMSDYSKILTVNATNNIIQKIHTIESSFYFIDNIIDNYMIGYDNNYFLSYDLNSNITTKFEIIWGNVSVCSSVIYLLEYNYLLCRNKQSTVAAKVDVQNASINFISESKIDCQEYDSNFQCTDENYLQVSKNNQQQILIVDSTRVAVKTNYEISVSRLYIFDPVTSKLNLIRVEKINQFSQFRLIQGLFLYYFNTQIVAIKQNELSDQNKYYLQNIVNSETPLIYSKQIDQIQYLENINVVIVLYYTYVYVFDATDMTLLYTQQIKEYFRAIITKNYLISVAFQIQVGFQGIQLYEFNRKRLEFILQTNKYNSQNYTPSFIQINQYVYIIQGATGIRLELKELTFSTFNINFTIHGTQNLNDSQILGWNFSMLILFDSGFNLIKSLKLDVSIKDVKIDKKSQKILIDYVQSTKVMINVYTFDFILETQHTDLPGNSSKYISLISCNAILFLGEGFINVYNYDQKIVNHKIINRDILPNIDLNSLTLTSDGIGFLPSFNKKPIIIIFKLENYDTLVNKYKILTLDKVNLFIKFKNQFIIFYILGYLIFKIITFIFVLDFSYFINNFLQQQQIVRWDLDFKKLKAYFFDYQQLSSLDLQEENVVKTQIQSDFELYNSFFEEKILLQSDFNLLLITLQQQDINVKKIKYYTISQSQPLFEVIINLNDQVLGFSQPVWWVQNQPVSIIVMKKQILMISFINGSVKTKTIYESKDELSQIYLSVSIEYTNQYAIVTKDEYNNKEICRLGQFNLYKKVDIVYNKFSHKIYMRLDKKVKDENNIEIITRYIAVVHIDNCQLQYYILNQEQDQLSRKAFHDDVIYLEVLYELYSYDILTSQLKSLNLGFQFYTMPRKLYDNIIFILNTGVLFLYKLGETTYYRKIQIPLPFTIQMYHYYQEKDILALFFNNEVRFYTLNEMQLIKKVYLSSGDVQVFSQEKSNLLYVIQVDSIYQLNVFNLDTLELIKYLDILSKQFNIYSNMNFLIYPDISSNIIFVQNGVSTTLLTLDLRIIFDQMVDMPSLNQFVYVTGYQQEEKLILHQKDLRHSIIYNCCENKLDQKKIEDYYNIDENGYISFIDSIQNKYKTIKKIKTSKFHLVTKKFDPKNISSIQSGYYVLIANDYEIICIMQDVILQTIQISIILQEFPGLIFLSSSQNLFGITNDSIFDIQYNFTEKKLNFLLMQKYNEQTLLMPIDILLVNHRTQLIFATKNALFFNKLESINFEGQTFQKFVKLSEDIFAVQSFQQIKFYSILINSEKSIKIQKLCNINNNQVNQYYLIDNKIFLIENSLSRLAIYYFQDNEDKCFEDQSIPLPCISGNKFLYSSVNGYIAISCSLSTNIYQKTAKSTSTESKIQQQNYYTRINSIKGHNINQLVVSTNYIFCPTEDKILVISCETNETVHEINLQNFKILQIQFIQKELDYYQIHIKGIKNYERVNFVYLAKQFSQNNTLTQTQIESKQYDIEIYKDSQGFYQILQKSNITQTQNSQFIFQLPLCYLNIYSSFTKKDQLKISESLKSYKEAMNLQVDKIILQVNLLQQIQLIDEFEQDLFELKVFSDPIDQRNIDIETLLKVNKQNIQYSGLSITIPENKIMKNPPRKNLSIQNSMFVNNVKNSVFYFQNLQSLILFNITFKCQEVEAKKTQQPFITFINITNLIVDELVIDGINKFQYREFIYSEKIEKLVMNKLLLHQIVSDTAVMLIRFNIINYLLMSNVSIQDIRISNLPNSSNQLKYVLQFEGIKEQIVKNVYAKNLLNISLSYSNNKYFQDSKRIILYNDNILHYNISCFNAQNTYSMIWVTATNYTLDGINNQFQFIKSPLSEGSVLKVQGSQVTIKNSYFANNIGYKGGAIQLLEIEKFIKMKNCTFEYNKAISFGGAMYVSASDLEFDNIIIRYNQALVGGGIYYSGSSPINIQNVYENQAEIYGNNLGSTLQYFDIIVRLDKNIVTNKTSNSVTINNFRSGDTINLDFQVYDEEKNPIRIIKKNISTYPSSIYDLIDSIKISAITFIQDSIKLSNQQSTSYLDYNESNNLWHLPNLKVIGSIDKTQRISIQSTKILNNLIQSESISKEYLNYTINFNFRPCQRGEKQSLIDDLIQCLPCSSGSYSLITPTENTNLECIVCPPEAYQCEKDQIYLKEGYWRSSNSTETIYYCEKQPSNCKGSLDGNRQYCSEGKIGPLCESCDIYGKLWDTKYMRSGKFDCVRCDDVKNQTFIFPMVGIFLFILIYVIFSVNMSIKMSKGFSYSYYLRLSKMISSSKSAYLDLSPFYFKILLNYIQISLVSNSYFLQIPPILAYLPDILSLPLQHFVNIFDCQFSQVDQQKVPLLFLRVMWSYFLPFLFMFIITLVYSILFCIQKCIYSNKKTDDLSDSSSIIINKSKKMMVYHLYNGMFFLLIFMQPSQVEILLSTISCREVDGTMYIADELTFQCYTNEHSFYIGTMIVPGLIIWIFIIPLSILYLLKKASNRLETLQVRFSFGFLYQEYKSESYYWEFVKSYFRIGIVLIGIFLNESPISKLIIICLFLSTYNYLANRNKPYILIKLNKFDQLQVNVLKIIALFNAIIENPPSQSLRSAMIVTTIVFHNSFLAISLFYAIYIKLESMFSNKILRIKIFLKKMFPLMFKNLDIRKPINLMRANKNWQKVSKLFKLQIFQNNLVTKYDIQQNNSCRPSRQANYFSSKQALNQQENSQENITSPAISKKKSPSPLQSIRYKPWELFKFKTQSILSKRNSSPMQKDDKAFSLSSIKEEESNFQIDVFNQMKGNSKILNNFQNQEIQRSSNIFEEQDDIVLEKPSYSIYKKRSGDNISNNEEEQQRINSTSKSQIQTQLDFQSIQGLSNSPNLTRKSTYEKNTKKGFQRGFSNSQSRYTTQAGTPQNQQYLQKYAKNSPSFGQSNNISQMNSQFTNVKLINSSEQFGIQLQKVQGSYDSFNLIQAYSQNLDLINSKQTQGKLNNLVKNDQLEVSLVYSNPYQTPTNINSRQKSDSKQFLSSSSLGSFISQNLNESSKIQSQPRYNEDQSDLSESQNQYEYEKNQNQFVDNPNVNSFQQQNIYSSVDLGPQMMIYNSNQVDFSTKYPSILSPNIYQSRNQLIDNVSQNNSILNKYAQNVSSNLFIDQKLELINFNDSKQSIDNN